MAKPALWILLAGLLLLATEARRRTTYAADGAPCEWGVLDSVSTTIEELKWDQGGKGQQ